MVSFAVQRLLSLIRSHLFFLALAFITVEDGSKKILLWFMSKSVLVSGLTFRSLIHFEFIFYMVLENVLCMKCSLVSLIFLKRSLVFPILLFSSTSLHWSLRKAFLCLPASHWNSAFKRVYLSFSPLPFASLLFSATCKPFSANYFAFWHFFFLGMALITASCTMSWTSVHSSSGTLSIRSNPLNLFVTSTV